MQRLHQPVWEATTGMLGGIAGSLLMVGWQWIFRRSLVRWRNHGYLADSGLGFQTLIRRREPSVEVSHAMLPAQFAQHRLLGAVFVHVGFGAATGAAYALTLRRFTFFRWPCGMPFGIVLWVSAAQVGMPLSGMTRFPWRSSARLQAFGLAAHLLYAAALETTCTLLADCQE